MPAQAALRVVLSHMGKSFQLESALRVKKIVQASDALEERRGEVGAWVVLQDSKGRALFRRNLQNPLGPREVFTGEEREMRQALHAEPVGVVTFLLPLLDDAAHLVLYASEVKAKKGASPAEPLFKIGLKQLLAKAKGGRPGRER